MTRPRRNRYRPVDTALSALRWAERRQDGEQAGTPARARYEEEARRLRDEYDARAAEARAGSPRRRPALADQKQPAVAQVPAAARSASVHASSSPAVADRRSAAS